MRKLCAVAVFLLSAASSFAQTTVCGATRPVIGATPAISATTAPGSSSCGVFIDVQPPAVQHSCPVTITVSGMPAGGVFPVGTTTLLWTARDANNNFATATQIVTVTDATAPLLAAVQDAVVLSTTIPVANVLPVPHAADNCSDVVVTASNAGPYPAGDTIVVWTATDASGNASSAVQRLTVVPAGTIVITSAMTAKQGRSTIYTPLPIDLRVFDIVNVANLGRRGIESAWNTATPLAAPYIELSSPAVVPVDGGSVYQYTATVPAGASYVPIARATVDGRVEYLHDRATPVTTGSVHRATFHVRAR